MQEAVLRVCSQEQLLIETQRHRLACEEVVALRESQQHEEDYKKQEAAERLSMLRRDLSEASLQNEQLKLEVLRWRKQCSLMRLKLASARENVQLNERNIELMAMRETSLTQDAVALKAQLVSAMQQLTDMTAAKAQAQAEWSKYQGQALQADMQVTKLSEEVKLANGRCSAATAQATELQQQLTAARAEVASLQKELDESCGRDSAAAAAHEQLRQSLDSLQNDLRRHEKQLVVEQKARATAEAAAAKATAAAEAAKEALAFKEQQLAEWKQLTRASKETATQQLQLSQAQLDSMREKASVKEAKLLDELALLKQQLEQEKAARLAAEANISHANKSAAADSSKATATNKALEAQLEQLTKQVTELEERAATAEKQAAAAEKQAAAAAKKSKLQADKAAALQQELEQLQEQQTKAAVQAVDNIVQELTQDASEPEAPAAAPAPRPSSGAGSRGRKATATAAKEPAVGSASKHQGRRRAAAAAAAESPRSNGNDDGNSQEQTSSALSDGEGDDDYKPMKAAAKSKAGAGAGHRADQARGTRGPVKDKSIEDTKQHPTPQSRGRGVEQQQNQQQNQQQRPVAASGVGRDGKRSSTGAKQAKDLAELAPAAVQPSAPAATSNKPPPLSFVPQSVATPAIALQQPGVMAAAQARMSATDMLKKLSAGGGLQGGQGKPGARKRKLGALPSASSSMSMDVIPPSLLVKPSFQAPKVRRPGP